MEKTYSYALNYYDVDLNETAFPVTLVNFMQDAATKHAYDIGIDGKSLGSENYGWMILQWDIDIQRYPKYGEKIHIKTRSIGFRKFMALRSFEIYDAQDKLIGTAMTKWVLVDIANKVNIDIPPLLPQGIDNNYNSSTYKFKKVRPKKTFQVTKDYRVTLNDIDSNGHVNNCKYIYWAFGLVPFDLYKNNYPSHFSVLYKRETHLEDTINIKGHHQEDTADYQTLFTNQAGDTLCIIDSEWAQR